MALLVKPEQKLEYAVDPEMKAYFERKVAEGKNKMNVINAVRNKLIHRVFTAIRDERNYKSNYVRNCA